MKLREWLKENGFLIYSDIEFYLGLYGNINSFHTDKIKAIDGDFESLGDYEVLTYEYMNEEEYNSSICANVGLKADFNEWFDNRYALILCFLLKEPEEKK